MTNECQLFLGGEFKKGKKGGGCSSQRRLFMAILFEFIPNKCPAAGAIPERKGNMQKVVNFLGRERIQKMKNFRVWNFTLGKNLQPLKKKSISFFNGLLLSHSPFILLDHA